MEHGVLHWIYITNNVESYQLVLPREYQQVLFQMLHDDYGHQGLDHTLAQAVYDHVLQCMWEFYL